MFPPSPVFGLKKNTLPTQLSTVSI